MITILLVRHADIGLPPITDDPSLNAAGKARANQLALVAGAAGVTTVFISNFARTKQTATPLAIRLGLAPQIIPETESFADKARAGTFGPVVLVVGHSDTIPALINALTKTSASITIGEKEFDNLFVVTITVAESRILQLKYGPEQV